MASSDPNSDRQREVASWFDSTYSKIGFKYLRPLEAYPIFLQLLGVKEGETLLDVACGPGLLLKAALMRGLRPSGVDISKEAVAIARGFAAGAEAQEGSSEKLPFADGCFRHVTCVGAIERFLDREKALSEMCRVAMADAKFCFMVRNSETAVWKVWRRWLGRQNVTGHQDALTLEEWSRLFERCGLEVEAVYMDQWCRQKLRKLLRGWRRHDFARPEPVARPILPLRYVNEFIFILHKRTGSQESA